MENETNTVEEVAGTLLPVPWITWTVEFDKQLPPEDIRGELPLIQDFLDAQLVRFVEVKLLREKRMFRYRWTPKRKGSHTYKLEIFALLDFNFSICRDNNKYVVFKNDPHARGSDKNTIKLKPPAV